MRFALRYLWAYSAFGLGLGTVYYALTQEWVGSIALWFLGLMPAIVALWWARHGPSPAVREADDPEADPAASAGASLGSFPMATAWPALLVAGVIVIGASLVYGLILLPVGAAMLVWAVVGLARESRG
ncbi:MAG: cytochrome c oxidase subunit 4 [Actinomycetota bacterium]|nr:cytochrome c oxidase subunit 4 [Actinomycetota bacterium]